MKQKTPRGLLKETQKLRKLIMENNFKINSILSENERLATKIVSVSIEMAKLYVQRQGKQRAR